MRFRTFVGIGALVLAGCAQMPMESATADDSLDATMKMAEEKLAMAQSANAEWRIIDKATGGAAVDLSKILDTARKQAEAGETDEAMRLAKRVIQYAELGLEQAKAQAGAGPRYE